MSWLTVILTRSSPITSWAERIRAFSPHLSLKQNPTFHLSWTVEKKQHRVLLIMQSMKVSDNIIPWQSTKNIWNSSAWLNLLYLDGTKMVEISRRPFSVLPLQLSIFNLPSAPIGSSTPWSSAIGLICKTTLLSLPCLRHLAAMQTFIFCEL